MNLTCHGIKRPLKAVMIGLGLAASLLSPIASAQPSLLVDTGAGSSSGLPLFGTGSTTCSPQPACASHFQYLAGQFTLPNGATLDSVQGWMSVGGAMSMVVRIYTDNSGVPGTSIFSKTYGLGPSFNAWQVFSSFNPVLAPGTYWLAFEPANGSSFQAAMPGGAPNPLPNYAFDVDGNNRYVNFSLFGQHPGLGMRVSGSTSTSPTFPSGTFTRVTQFDTCCFNVVVDNVDDIKGGIGSSKTVSLGGSEFGIQFAEAAYTSIVLNGNTVATNGPTAGAFSYSDFGVGSGRGVSFGSFNNNLTVPQTFRVNAVLEGAFLNDSCGVFGCLPNGILRAGAAVHVFDTDKFNAAFNASGMNPGQLLMSGYPASMAIDPSAVFQSVAAILGSAQIDPGKIVIFGNTCFPDCTPIPVFDQFFTTPMSTGFFTVGAGKSFTVMFDVIASGVSQSLGDTIGTGQVDFVDTLKPAANIFTDVNGNPITGISAVGPQPVIPPPATNLALAPATGSDPVGSTHTVTATATDASAVPVSNTIVKFNVLSGPNAGMVGGGITDANGHATFSYTGKGGLGTDSIQARVGTLQSNIVQETWQPAKCPQGQGFWKNTNAWPLSSLVLGSQTYSQAELLQILGAPGHGDASQILAVQLIAAKLSIANGSDRTPVRATIITADVLLSGFSGKLPYGVSPSSANGQSMTQAGAMLDQYNSGQLTPSCTP